MRDLAGASLNKCLTIPACLLEEKIEQKSQLEQCVNVTAVCFGSRRNSFIGGEGGCAALPHPAPTTHTTLRYTSHQTQSDTKKKTKTNKYNTYKACGGINLWRKKMQQPSDRKWKKSHSVQKTAQVSIDLEFEKELNKLTLHLMESS